jgi:AcrR family transcriptional regulator
MPRPRLPDSIDARPARARRWSTDAATALIAQGRGERASIQEITDAADIGFGSFYNHFSSKDELFRTASEEVLERWAQMIDAACAGLDDPADELTEACLRLLGLTAAQARRLARLRLPEARW